MRNAYWLTSLAACVALAGCASTQPVAYSGIESSSKLVANRGDQSGRVPYTYDAQIDWASYRQVIVDPVEIYQGRDNQFEKMSQENKERLANYMRQEFAAKLGSVFQVTDTPSPNAIRVKLTLTGAKPTPAVIGPAFRIDLLGGPYNAVQGVRGKEGSAMGWVMYAVEIEDASTHQLLSAYVTKQYPNAMNMKASFGAMGASMAGVRKGADELAEKLRR